MSVTSDKGHPIEETIESLDDPMRTIFIGGIPLTSSLQLITDYVQQFGEVDDIVLPKSLKSDKLKGYAKVRFSTEEGATRMICFKNHNIGGLKVGISRWTNNEEYLRNKEELATRKVYVKFKERVGVDEVERYFSQFGTIQQFDVKRHPYTGRFRDFGYLLFETVESAKAAAQKPAHTINNHQVRCELSKPNLHHQKVKVETQAASLNSMSDNNHDLTPATEYGSALKGALPAAPITDLAAQSATNSLSIHSSSKLKHSSSKIQVKESLNSYLHYAGKDGSNGSKPLPSFPSKGKPLKTSPLCAKDEYRGRMCQEVTAPANYIYEAGLHLLRPNCRIYFNYFRSAIDRNHMRPDNLYFSVRWPCITRPV